MTRILTVFVAALFTLFAVACGGTVEPYQAPEMEEEPSEEPSEAEAEDPNPEETCIDGKDYRFA